MMTLETAILKENRVVWCALALFQLLIKRAVVKESVFWLAQKYCSVGFYNTTIKTSQQEDMVQ